MFILQFAIVPRLALGERLDLSLHLRLGEVEEKLRNPTTRTLPDFNSLR